MFGGPNLKKIIQAGNLERLKKVLEKKPDTLDKYFQKGSDKPENILHMAAYYNQPTIIKFLVKDKGLDVDKRSSTNATALQWAAYGNAYEAAAALLQLGANPNLMNRSGRTAGSFSQDARIKELLRPVREERERQQAQQQQEAARTAAAAKAEGKWTANESGEITHEHTLPGEKYQLTEAFNLPTGRLITITKDLRDGQLSQTVQYRNEENKELFNQAAAKLAELTNGPVSEIAASPAQTRDRSYGYTDLTSV